MFYALDKDGNPVKLPSFADAKTDAEKRIAIELSARAWEESSRRVAETTGFVDGVRTLVSTVFLTINHNFSEHGDPILWETMIFKETDDDTEYCERFCTLQEAIAGHKAAVVHALSGVPTQTLWGSLPTMDQGQIEIEYVYLPSRWQRLLEENDLV